MRACRGRTAGQKRRGGGAALPLGSEAGGGGGHAGPFGIKENFRRGTVVQVSEVTGGGRAPEEDGEVPGFWRRLGVPGLADVHTHFLPPRMMRRVWEYFDSAGPLVGVRWPIRPEEAPARCYSDDAPTIPGAGQGRSNTP